MAPAALRRRSPPPPPPPPLVDLQIPLYFRCPISLDLMSDPVILCTGQTYDRQSIERWVANGNSTCPVTMQKLEDFTLIPNHTLRRLLQDWCVANNVERVPTPRQPADLALIRSLMEKLEGGGGGGDAVRVEALRKLRCLAKEGEKNRMVMVEAGAVALVLDAVFEGGDGAVSEEALATAVALPLSDADRLAVATEARLRYLSETLRRSSSSAEGRVNAAALVEMVSESTEDPEMRVRLAKTEGMMEGLVALLREKAEGKGEAAAAAAKVAIKAIFSLCLKKEGKEAAAAAGAAAALVAKLPECLKRGDAERALGALELLCTTEAGLSALSARSGFAVEILVGFILKVSDRATEFATAALLSLCSVSEAAQMAAVNAGVVTELLLLIQSDATHRAKVKAMSLLKLVRSAYDHHHFLMLADNNTGLRSDVVPF